MWNGKAAVRCGERGQLKKDAGEGRDRRRSDDRAFGNEEFGVTESCSDHDCLDGFRMAYEERPDNFFYEKLFLAALTVQQGAAIYSSDVVSG